MAYGGIYTVYMIYYVPGTTRVGVNIWRHGDFRGLRVKEVLFKTLHHRPNISLYTP